MYQMCFFDKDSYLRFTDRESFLDDEKNKDCNIVIVKVDKLYNSESRFSNNLYHSFTIGKDIITGEKLMLVNDSDYLNAPLNKIQDLYGKKGLKYPRIISGYIINEKEVADLLENKSGKDIKKYIETVRYAKKRHYENLEAHKKSRIAVKEYKEIEKRSNHRNMVKQLKRVRSFKDSIIY